MQLDLVIIGGGPAGLTAGIYAASRKLRCLVLEAGDAGGQPMNIYPEKGLENYPGLMVPEAKELAHKMVSHAQAAGCELRLQEAAIDIEDKEDHLLVRSTKDEYEAKAVILAIGAGLFKPKRLGARGEIEFEGKGVYYKLPDRSELIGKKTVFVGGGNSALEMALLACDISDVCVVHRRDQFRADTIYVERISASGAETYMSSEIEEIAGTDKVQKVVLKVGDPPKRVEVPADMVIINIGFTPENSELQRWNLALDNGLITVNTEMKTSRRGIFACGDIVTYPGKYKQIVTACGEGATAANSAYKYINKPYWA
jgi:thioredoxin reductase (NADPH)